jgi:hypothetical protein
MSYDQHPMRRDALQYHADLDGDQQRWFIKQAPDARRVYLGQLEAAVTAADGQSLRKKAQVMRDFQTLREIDRELRWLNR